MEDQGEKLNEINNAFSDDGSSPENFYTATLQQPIEVNDTYKMRVILKIIEICSMGNYSNIPNFRWYLGVLTDMIKLNVDNRIPDVDRILSEQFVDICIKVPSIRPQVVETCIELIKECDKEDAFNGLLHGLKNFVWIIGEYYVDYMNASTDSDDSEEVESDEDDDSEIGRAIKERIPAPEIVELISGESSFTRLSNGNSTTDDTVAVYIQSMAKLFSKYCLTLGDQWQVDDFKSVGELSNNLVSWLEQFHYSVNYEVQERAVSFTELLKLVGDSIKQEIAPGEDGGGGLEPGEYKSPPHLLTVGYSQLFNNYQIKPISSTIQDKIPVPEDLDLDSAINEEAMGEFMAILQKINEKDIQQAEQEEENLLAAEETELSHDEYDLRSILYLFG
ncbi:unnamed protein product [Ambrosiozyma monospora]|uniref:Unnamed protein product n=1 Tax=Ambrosiozyma monospora TaxID=43982 RepID=A0A9W6T4I1_AMBMO|nr:unnamed protein product [Ambrosiozyma monospora]